jgi:hypothetical protein
MKYDTVLSGRMLKSNFAGYGWKGAVVPGKKIQ